MISAVCLARGKVLQNSASALKLARTNQAIPQCLNLLAPELGQAEITGRFSAFR